MTGPRPTWRQWTAREERWLRDNYRYQGVAECARQLGRKQDSVRNKATNIGLSRKHGRYELTPTIEADIRGAYPHPKKGQVQAICQRHGVPREWVLRKAWEIGAKVPRGDGGNGRWTEEELQILNDKAHLSCDGVVKALKRKGYHRTTAAVAYRRWQERVTADQSGYHSATQAAELIGIRPETMASECRRGRIKAKAHDSQGADHQTAYAWMIHERDLRRYIMANPTTVRRDHVDLVWLIDLLTNGG